jgi:hypothetical protein
MAPVPPRALRIARDQHKSIGADVLDPNRRVTTFNIENVGPFEAP